MEETKLSSFDPVTPEGSYLKLYRGVVEDIYSPKKDGRVRVRIYGLHTDDKTLLPTKALPWAEVVQSLSFGFGSGIGISSVPREGTWVFVYLDHGNPNNPVVIGAMTGKLEKMPDRTKGFTAESEEELPLKGRVGEEDINRLCRVENLGQTIDAKINGALFGTEPKSTNANSTYPMNNVIETISGHVIEVDDSGGNERIRILHRTGTYIEIKPDGSIVTKSNGKSNHIALTGNLDEVIGGYVKEKISQYLDINVQGDITIKSAGNITLQSGGNFTVSSGGNINETAGGTAKLQSSSTTIIGGSTLVV